MGQGFIRKEKGAAMVEFAIVLPLLLILLFGIIELSIALYDKAVLTNASREGARAGIVAQNPRVADAAIRNTVRNYCSTYLITFGNDILDDGDISITPASRNLLPFGTPLQVTVTYRYDFLVLSRIITILMGPITLNASTVMNLE
jgi:Flp pilus assembly protein TadG